MYKYTYRLNAKPKNAVYQLRSNIVNRKLCSLYLKIVVVNLRGVRKSVRKYYFERKQFRSKIAGDRYKNRSNNNAFC